MATVVDSRGLPELTQHFPLPLPREIRKDGGWSWTIAEGVDVGNSIIKRPACESLRWIFLAGSNFFLHADPRPKSSLDDIFSPSAEPPIPLQPQLAFLGRHPTSRIRRSLVVRLTSTGIQNYVRFILLDLRIYQFPYLPWHYFLEVSAKIQQTTRNRLASNMLIISN
jgi:hypothetical protein